MKNDEVRSGCSRALGPSWAQRRGASGRQPIMRHDRPWLHALGAAGLPIGGAVGADGPAGGRQRGEGSGGSGAGSRCGDPAAASSAAVGSVLVCSAADWLAVSSISTAAGRDCRSVHPPQVVRATAGLYRSRDAQPAAAVWGGAACSGMSSSGTCSSRRRHAEHCYAAAAVSCTGTWQCRQCMLACRPPGAHPMMQPKASPCLPPALVVFVCIAARGPTS